jgi:hypothetical protein
MSIFFTTGLKGNLFFALESAVYGFGTDIAYILSGSVSFRSGAKPFVRMGRKAKDLPTDERQPGCKRKYKDF